MDYQQGSGSNSREVVTKNATQGAFAVGGGVVVLIVGSIASIPILGAIVGAGMIVGGLTLRSRKVKSSAVSGIVLAALGGLTLVSSLAVPLLGGIAGAVLTISGFGLIAFGAWKLWNFYKGFKERSR